MQLCGNRSRRGKLKIETKTDEFNARNDCVQKNKFVKKLKEQTKKLRVLALATRLPDNVLHKIYNMSFGLDLKKRRRSLK